MNNELGTMKKKKAGRQWKDVTMRPWPTAPPNFFIDYSANLTTSRLRLQVFQTGAAGSLNYCDLIRKAVNESGARMESLEAVSSASICSRFQGLASNADIS